RQRATTCERPPPAVSEDPGGAPHETVGELRGFQGRRRRTVVGPFPRHSTRRRDPALPRGSLLARLLLPLPGPLASRLAHEGLRHVRFLGSVC
ncbi:hypothetical protein IscW_ISCW011977, partial [Ixodes scapularis]